MSTRAYREAHREELRAYYATYYETHREQERARVARYNETHREERAASRLKRLYGLSVTEYDALLAAQNGKCAICGRDTANRLGHNLAVDHDHSTGEVRGLLCASCNLRVENWPPSRFGHVLAARYMRKSVQVEMFATLELSRNG
jgi:5-methylcytosine-specific restriction endonuclease McrA